MITPRSVAYATPNSFFQKLIRDGHVKVNDSIAKANYRLRMDDLVCVEIPDAVETPILPEDIPLDILLTTRRSSSSYKISNVMFSG